MWVFFHEHSRSTGLQGKGEGISLSFACLRLLTSENLRLETTKMTRWFALISIGLFYFFELSNNS